MRKRRPVRFVLPVLALALLAAFQTWRVLNSRREAPPNLILANGTIEATEVDVSPKITGRIMRLTVDEGDEVTAGQVIAVLEGEEVKAQVNQAEGAYRTAQARLADLLRGAREEDIRQARAALAQAEAAAEGARRSLAIAREAYAKSTELKAQLVSAEAAYEAAKNAHKQAKAKLELVEAGARREQIEQAEAAVQQARALAVKGRQDAERAEKLYASGAIAKQQWDAAVSQRDAAEAALAAAEARLAELKAGARPEERDQARAAEAQAAAQLEGARLSYETIRQLYADRLTAKQQVQAAQTQYETALKQVAAARARLDLLLAGATKESISAARGQVQQALGALKAAKATSDYLVVKSPVSGTVILKTAELGEFVSAGMPIVRIADLDSVWVRVYVPEPKLRVRVGDRADVEVDAYPGRKFPGRVTEVSQKPEFTPKNVQTKDERVKLVFGVKIQLSNPGHELKPGMPADAEIHVADARRR